MGTGVEWNHVAFYVAAFALLIVVLELSVELAGVKNNPRRVSGLSSARSSPRLIVRHDQRI
jgi:hypothetical protein